MLWDRADSPGKLQVHQTDQLPWGKLSSELAVPRRLSLASAVGFSVDKGSSVRYAFLLAAPYNLYLYFIFVF